MIRVAMSIVSALAVALAVAAPAMADEARVVAGVSVWPQFTQFVGSEEFPTEVYGIDVLLPVARRVRVSGRVDGRRDFVLAGVGVSRDVSVSSLREWRVSAGVDVAFPLGDAHDAVLRWSGGELSLVDRLALRLGMGQTFDFAESAFGFRVGYDLRLVGRGSALARIESFDDEVDEGRTFAIHALRAAVEFRLEGR